MFAEWALDHQDNAWGSYMLGLSARRIGDYERAEAALRHAIEIDPTHLKSRINLARVLLDAERPDEALTELDSAMRPELPTSDIYRLQGRAMHQLGDLQQAADAYREPFGWMTTMRGP
jgi:predicted Zn-dependent protease